MKTEQNQSEAYTYKSVYIGTGPIAIADAAVRYGKDPEVLFLDRNAQPGGAWAAIPVIGYGDLEIGCHIWSYNKKAYRFMRSFYGLELIPLMPSPYLLRNGRRFSYDYKRSVTTFKRIISKIGKFKFSELATFLRKNASARMPIVPKTYLYPVGGARALQIALINKLEEMEYACWLTDEVTELVQEKDEWKLMMKSGRVFNAKEVTITSTSTIRRITHNAGILDLEFRKINYTHMHVAIKGKLKKNLSYVRVLNDRFIHRISDITYQLSDEKQRTEITMLLVGILDDQQPADQTEEEKVDYIRNFLFRQQYITEANEILYTQKNNFETAYLGDEQFKIINNISPNLRMMQTTDLMYGIYYRLKDWKL